MNGFFKYINFMYVHKLVYLWFWCLYISYFFHFIIFFFNLNHDVWYIKSFDIIIKTIHHGVYLTFMLEFFTRHILRYQVEFYLSLTLPRVDYALEKGSLMLCLSIVQYVYTFEKLQFPVIHELLDTLHQVGWTLFKLPSLFSLWQSKCISTND